MPAPETVTLSPRPPPSFPKPQCSLGQGDESREDVDQENAHLYETSQTTQLRALYVNSVG